MIERRMWRLRGPTAAALLLVLLIFSDSAALIQAATTPGDAHDENEERKQQALNGKDETDQHEGAAAHGWSHDLEQTMLDQIIVGVMTSGKRHDNVKIQASTWMTKARLAMIEVYSDVPNDPAIPNLVYSFCDDTAGYTDWCKLTHMLKVWSTPPYNKVEWFVVAQDTAYLHLENLFKMLQAYDPYEPRVIGDIQCKEDGLKYPAGTGAFVLSRGFFEQVVWEQWYEMQRRPLRPKKYVFDELLGSYAKATQMTLTHSPGIIAAAYSSDSTLLKTFIQWRDQPWPFTFRPIASNQANHMDFMPELHTTLHSFEQPDAKVKFPSPPVTCACKDKFASRCLYDATLSVEAIPCLHSETDSKCLPGGPFSTESYAKLAATATT